MNTGHFEVKYQGEDTWEACGELQVGMKGNGVDTLATMKSNPGVEYKLSPFASYRWVEDK